MKGGCTWQYDLFHGREISAASFFVRLFSRLSEGPEYHHPLKTVAWEDRSSHGHWPAMVNELSCIGSQSIYSGWLSFTFFKECVVRCSEMAHNCWLQQNGTAVHTVISVSAGFNGSPEPGPSAVGRIGRGQFAAYLRLLSNRFWPNTPCGVQVICLISSAASDRFSEAMEAAINNEDAT